LKGVRPTTAKVLESLFAILEPELEGARVLDLFAGTGALGLEAVRRGALSVTFVEGNPTVAKGLRGKGQLVTGRLPRALERVADEFAVVLADPPYGDPAGPATLEVLGRREAVMVAVFEHHHKDPYPESTGRLRLARQRRFGETALSFYRPASSEGLPAGDPNSSG